MDSKVPCKECGKLLIPASVIETKGLCDECLIKSEKEKKEPLDMNFKVLLPFILVGLISFLIVVVLISSIPSFHNDSGDKKGINCILFSLSMLIMILVSFFDARKFGNGYNYLLAFFISIITFGSLTFIHLVFYKYNPSIGFIIVSILGVIWQGLFYSLLLWILGAAAQYVSPYTRKRIFATKTEDFKKCESCGNQNSPTHFYSFYYGGGFTETWKNISSSGYKTTYFIKGQAEALICDGCTGRRQRRFSGFIIIMLVLTLSIIFSYGCMVLSDKTNFDKDVFMGMWGLPSIILVFAICGFAIVNKDAMGEQIAIKIKSPELKKQGHSQFITNDEYKRLEKSNKMESI